MEAKEQIITLWNLLLWCEGDGKPPILYTEVDENEIHKYPLYEIVQKF